jgi:CHAT domain-containing protein
VAGLYGITPLVGKDCSGERLAAMLDRGPVDMIHLAVHGTGDRAAGQSSGLLLADGEGGTAVVRFDELCELGLQADVVVLSGCSTAVTGPLHGRELVGVALAAIEAGAQSVVGCLWPVDDRAAQRWMCEFHRCVVERAAAGVVDLRRCMDSARRVLRAVGDPGARQQVRDLREVAPEPLPGVAGDVRSALAWAPFVLFGSPFLNLGDIG